MMRQLDFRDSHRPDRALVTHVWPSVLRGIVVWSLILAGPWSVTASAQAPGPAAAKPAPPHPASLNGRERRAGSSGPWRFLVGGHLYGDPAGSLAPAGTLAKALKRLDGLDPDFVLALGDTFRSFAEPSRSETLRVLRQLRAPIYDAIGNHEATLRDTYLREFPAPTAAFRHRDALIVLLDTEREPWQVRGPERALVAHAADELREDPTLRNLFICGHKVVFAGQPGFEALAHHLNAYDNCPGANDFGDAIVPLLAPVAATKGVYWFAGDVGVSWSLPLFRHVDPTTHITYVATGLGDLSRDLFLRVDLSESGAVTLVPVPLDPEAPVPPIEDCGLASWRKHFEKK